MKKNVIPEAYAIPVLLHLDLKTPIDNPIVLFKSECMLNITGKKTKRKSDDSDLIITTQG